MKTVSFHDFAVGRKASQTLLELDTASQGIRLKPGLNLIVAPNGQGKTTFLQTLSGVLPPLHGTVRCDDERPLDPPKDLVYVSEYLTFPKFIFPPEWIEFASGRRWKDIEPELKDWITEFQIDSKMKSYLGRMSQGERRKVTWLATHVAKRPLALLDEPFDGLDIFGIRAARGMLETWRKEGRILCVVAHQVGELLDLSDEIFLIRGKRLLAWDSEIGVPAKTMSSDEFRMRVLEFYR